MEKRMIIFFAVLLFSCSSKDTYDIARYYDVPEQDKVLTGIITYIFDAPPLTPMKDRFKEQHRNYYSFLSSRFTILKYFISDDGTHYFYIVRPAPSPKEKRGVGGHFKMDDNFQITDFREVFVTPILPDEDVKGRCAFLFDEMVKGSVDKFLTMESYVQWPNAASYYDTLTYEWKLKPEFDQVSPPTKP